jgi:hypothetical protein
VTDLSKVTARVYGNQHGTWVVFDPETRRLIDEAAALTGKTPEEFVADAVNEYADRVNREVSS